MLRGPRLHLFTNLPSPYGQLLSIFQEELIPILLKVLHMIETEGALPKSFYKATVTLIPKPHRDSTGKENHRPLLLTNMDAKILNKVLL